MESMEFRIVSGCTFDDTGAVCCIVTMGNKTMAQGYIAIRKLSGRWEIEDAGDLHGDGNAVDFLLGTLNSKLRDM